MEENEQIGHPKKYRQNQTMMILLIALCSLVLLIGLGLLAYYKYTRFNMFGQPSDIYMEEISFEGAEIPDLDTLKDYLKKFKNLRSVDLGTYKVEAEDAVSLRQAFPKTNMKFDTVIEIEGHLYRTDITELSLTDHGFTDCKAFLKKLEFLPDLQVVKFGNNKIPHSEKELLQTAYPDVEFDVSGTYDIYGKTVSEYAINLDLRDAQLDATLFDQLSLLPNLKYVDLHDQTLSEEERITLATKYPDVSFGWSITYNGEEYDSSITELDLSGTSLTAEDLDTLYDVVVQLPDLEKLILIDCGLGNDTLQEFQDRLEDVKVVWRVYLGKWSVRTDQVAFSVLIVHYDYRRMTSADIEVLKYCTDLKALDLGHQAISDLSVIGDYLPELRLLILADNQVHDITPLARLTHLHYLELFVNKISDISPLAGLKELVDVNISYNYALSNIDPLLNSPMMEKVWLEATAVSAASFQKLRDTYPNAKVVSYGSGSVDQGWRWNDRYNQMMDMWFNDYYGDEFAKYDALAGHD